MESIMKKATQSKTKASNSSPTKAGGKVVPTAMPKNNKTASTTVRTAKPIKR